MWDPLDIVFYSNCSVGRKIALKRNTGLLFVTLHSWTKDSDNIGIIYTYIYLYTYIYIYIYTYTHTHTPLTPIYVFITYRYEHFLLLIFSKHLPQEVLMVSRSSAYFHLLRSYFLVPAAALVACTAGPL